MKIIDFKEEAIIVTRMLMNEEPDQWVTFNNKLNSRIVTNNDDVTIPVSLFKNELVIFECNLPNSNFIITTNRVISIVDGVLDRMLFSDFDGYLKEIKSESKYPEVIKRSIKKLNGDILVYYVDSYHPEYFSTNLIYNLYSKIKYDKWYIDPR